MTTETADLRRKADDDVAAVREWSKVEIARIREETEGRISARKANLESEIARHATQIEREVEIVQGRVSEFETEMTAFFERLLAESDYLMGPLRRGRGGAIRGDERRHHGRLGHPRRGARCGAAPRPPRWLGASTGIHEIWWSRHWIS